jgi:hypothetical protein
MWRFALLSLVLTLSGCGYKTWWNPPFSAGNNPNLPVDDSENMHRVLGYVTEAKPLETEPGDIWPGPLPQAPTLQDLESNGGLTPQPEAPVPGSPLNRGTESGAPNIPPTPNQGSSTPPSNLQSRPGLATPRSAPPLSSYATPATPPSSGSPGPVVQSPGGANVITGGGPGYQTTTGPGGGQSIVVPNGNGTSTIIHADGRIETVPTPK